VGGRNAKYLGHYPALGGEIRIICQDITRDSRNAWWDRKVVYQARERKKSSLAKSFRRHGGCGRLPPFSKSKALIGKEKEGFVSSVIEMVEPKRGPPPVNPKSFLLCSPTWADQECCFFPTVGVQRRGYARKIIKQTHGVRWFLILA